MIFPCNVGKGEEIKNHSVDGIFWDSLCYTNIAIGNCHRNSGFTPLKVVDLSIVMQQFTRPGSLCYTSHWKKTCWIHSVQSQLAKSVTSSPLNKFQLSHGPTRGRPTNTSKVTMIPQGPVSSIRKSLAIYHFLKITVYTLHASPWYKTVSTINMVHPRFQA